MSFLNSMTQALNHWGIWFCDFSLGMLIQSSILILLLLLMMMMMMVDWGLRTTGRCRTT